jgi:hypothetical protein
MHQKLYSLKIKFKSEISGNSFSSYFTNLDFKRLLTNET